jgi:cysteine-rich repeat protein
MAHEDGIPQTLAVDLTGPWVDDSTPTQIVVLMVHHKDTGKLTGVAVRPGDDSALGFISGDVERDSHGEYSVHLQSLAARVPPNATPSGAPCAVGSNDCCGGLTNCFCQGRGAGSPGTCRANSVAFTMSGVIKLTRPAGDPVLDLQGTLSLVTASQSSQDTDVEVFLRRAPVWYQTFFGTNGSVPADLSANPDLDCLGGTSNTADDAPDDPDVEGPSGKADGIPDACLEFLEEQNIISVGARDLLTQYRCGDGVVQSAPPFSEQCDDGNSDDGDDCVGVCVEARCGDGFADTRGNAANGLLEECDDGANNADNKDCLPDCTFNKCGDNHLDSDGTDPQRHEECDIGKLTDGTLDDTGDCVHCQFAKCGDGVTHNHRSNPPLANAGPLEQCDDANASDEDHCLTSCVLNTCGDGHVDQSIDPATGMPYEECDLGVSNSQFGDCVPQCKRAHCGDGYLHTQGTPPFEVCEPPQEPAAPGCNESCTLLDTDDFQVNTTYTLSQEAPAVAAWPDGSFVIVFQTADTQQPAYNYDFGIRARLFNEDGGPHTSTANPLGFDFLANAHLEGKHTNPVVTARVVGGQKSFVVSWMKLEAGNLDVEARVFDGDGNALPVQGYDCAGNQINPGDEFCVPFVAPMDLRHADHDQAHPSIASDAAGNFVIVYDDDSTSGPDKFQKGIRARMFGPDAMPLATPLGNANTDCNPPPSNPPPPPAPACCASATCDFQVNTTWEPTKFLPDSMGTACNGASSRNCLQVTPSVAMNDSGAFVVAYVDYSQDPASSATWPPDLDVSGGDTEVRARVFGPGGTPVGTPQGTATLACDPRNSGFQPSCCAQSTCDFVVNTTTAGDQDSPVVGVASDGSFLIAWADQSVVSPAPDPNVRYRAFLASGAPRDRVDKMLATTTANSQTAPTGARGPNGFFFAWRDTSGQTISNPADIRGISLSLDGTQSVAGDFRLNLTNTEQEQSAPWVAVAGNGTIIVTFKDASYANTNCTQVPSTPDCIEAGVRAHIFYRGRTP